MPARESTQLVRVRIAHSDDEGSCNGCLRHATVSGHAPHTVYVIEVRGSSIRLCYDCFRALRKTMLDYT